MNFPWITKQTSEKIYIHFLSFFFPSIFPPNFLSRPFFGNQTQPQKNWLFNMILEFSLVRSHEFEPSYHNLHVCFPYLFPLVSMKLYFQFYGIPLSQFAILRCLLTCEYNRVTHEESDNDEESQVFLNKKFFLSFSTNSFHLPFHHMVTSILQNSTIIDQVEYYYVQTRLIQIHGAMDHK